MGCALLQIVNQITSSNDSAEKTAERAAQTVPGITLSPERQQVWSLTTIERLAQAGMATRHFRIVTDLSDEPQIHATVDCHSTLLGRTGKAFRTPRQAMRRKIRKHGLGSGYVRKLRGEMVRAAIALCLA